MRQNALDVFVLLLLLLPALSWSKRLGNYRNTGDPAEEGFAPSDDGQFWVKPDPIEAITPGEMRDLHRKGMRMHEVKEKYFKEFGKQLKQKYPDHEIPNDYFGEEDDYEDLVTTDERSGSLGSSFVNLTNSSSKGPEEHCRMTRDLQMGLADRQMYFNYDKQNGHAYVGCLSEPTTYSKVSCLSSECAGASWCFVPDSCTHCGDPSKITDWKGTLCCRPLGTAPTCKPMTSVVTTTETVQQGVCGSPKVKLEWSKLGLFAQELDGKEVTLRCRSDHSKKYTVKCDCKDGKPWCYTGKQQAACPSTDEADFATVPAGCTADAYAEMKALDLRAVQSTDKGKRTLVACKDQQSLTYKVSCIKKECKNSPWCFVKSSCGDGILKSSCSVDTTIRPKCPKALAMKVQALDLLMVKVSFKTSKGYWLRLNWVGTVKKVDTETGLIKVYFGGQVDEDYKILPSELVNFRKIDYTTAALATKTFKGVKSVVPTKNTTLGIPAVMLVYDQKATYETIARTNPVIVAKVLKNPASFPELPADFKEYITRKNIGLSDWFDVGEIWSDYLQNNYIVLGYDYLESTTLLRPFEYKTGDPMKKEKVDSLYEHRGNAYTGVKGVMEPLKITIRSSKQQTLFYTPENTLVIGRHPAPDSQVEFQLIPGDVPGTMYLATLDFSYISMWKGKTSYGKQWNLILAQAKHEGKSSDLGTSSKSQGTPFFVIFHQDGTVSLQTPDGYYVRPHHQLDNSRLVAEETRFDPTQHKFDYDLSLSDPKQTSDELAPPTEIKPTLLSGYFCVQFDLDLWMLSGGTFPGLISVSFMAEVHKVPETKCWGWSGSIQFQVSIGFTVAGMDFRAGVQMIATLQVDEVPLSSAEGDLQWIIPDYRNIDQCFTKDPFDLFDATVKSAWSFVRQKFLKNPFKDEFWENPEVQTAKLMRREEEDAASLKDYNKLMQPPAGIGGVDDPVKLWVKGWSGDLTISAWVAPAFMSRIPNHKVTMAVFQDIGEVSYFESSNAKPLAREIDFTFNLDPGSARVVLVQLLIKDGKEIKYKLSGRFLPETKQSEATTVKDRIQQSSLINPKKQTRDLLSLTFLDARLTETTTGGCKGQKVEKVNIVVTASPSTQYEATWSERMLGDHRTGEFDNAWGMSLEDEFTLASTAEGVGISARGGDVDPFQNVISIQTMDKQAKGRLVAMGVEKGEACWKQVGSGLCGTLMAISESPSGEASNIISREHILKFLGNLFSDQSTRRALVQTIQRPALRQSFESVVSVLPEDAMECARLAMTKSGDGSDVEAEGSDVNEDVVKAVLKCADKKQTPKDQIGEDGLDVKYVWKWRMYKERTINNNNADVCRSLKIPHIVLNKDDTKEILRCQKACKEHQDDVVKRNISGTLDREEVGYCNAVRFESFPSEPGGTCLFFDCTRWDSFDEKKGHAVIVHMAVPVEGKARIVPADVALASTPAWLLDALFLSLSNEDLATLLDALGAYILASKEGETPENLAAPIADYWKKMTAPLLEPCNGKTKMPDMEDLEFRLPDMETPVETTIKNCLFQDDTFLGGQAIKKILPAAAQAKKEKTVVVNTKVRTNKNSKVPEQLRSLDISKRGTQWTEELKYTVKSGCVAKVKATWAWQTGNARGFLTRPEVVPVAQAFFAAWDQFTSKLKPYSLQVLDRILPNDDSAFWSKFNYEKTNGRVLHRHIETKDLDSGKVNVSKGDQAVNDAVYNFPLAFEKSKFKTWPSFAYNSGLSVANLFLRSISDVQALFNLYFANHPDWDGQCMSLPSRFHLFYEGNKKDPSKWGMHATSHSDGSRPDPATSERPTHRAGNTVGEKGKKLTEDEEKLILDWHWIAKPFWFYGRRDRAAFFKAQPPMHGTDHFSALEPGDANAVMWPAIWCELVEQQWVVHKIAAVRRQLQDDLKDTKEKYEQAEQTGSLKKVPKGLKVNLPKARAALDEKPLTCKAVFPSGISDFQKRLERRNYSEAEQLFGKINLADKWAEVYENQRTVHEFMEKKVLAFLRAQVERMRAAKQASCETGYLQDGLCWVWGGSDMKARDPWRAPTEDEYAYKPDFSQLKSHCASAVLGDKDGKCALKDLCLCRTVSDKACECGKRRKSIVLVSEAKGEMNVDALNAKLPKEEVLSKLEKEVDSVEALVESIFRDRQKESGTVHKVGTLLRNLMSPDYLANAEMRATTYAQLRTAKDSWEAMTLDKASSWDRLFQHAATITEKVLDTVPAEMKTEGKTMMETIAYAEAFTQLGMAQQKRCIAEYGILLSCIEQALRPMAFSEDGLTPFIPKERWGGLAKQVESLVKSGKLNGGFDVDAVDLHFDDGCAVPTDFNGTGPVTGPSRPECERVVLTKAFVTVMPNLTQKILKTFHGFEDDLRKLVETPTLANTQVMLNRLEKYLNEFRMSLNDDFFQSFGYHSDGTLHGEMWHSLTDALTSIRLSLDERKERRLQWIAESVALKAEFDTKRRLRARSVSAEEKMKEEQLMPSNIDGCACKKTWTATLHDGWFKWNKKSFEGCVNPQNLSNAKEGKIWGFKDKYYSWPGICPATDALSERCKEKGYVPCDAKKTWDDVQKMLIWRRTDPTRRNYVKLPIFTISFYATIDVRLSRSDFCTPDFSEIIFEASFAWATSSWKPYEEQFSRCLTVRIQPPGAGLHITRCNHKSTDALTGEKSSYTEWSITGTFYIVSTVDVWGTGDGDMTKSWFGGGDTSWTSTFSENGFPGALSSTVWSNPGGYGGGTEVADGFGYLNTAEVVSSPYAFVFGLIAQALTMFVASEFIGGVKDVDPASGEEEHSKSLAEKSLMPLVSIIWTVMKSVGFIPSSWIEKVTSKFVANTIGSFVFSPCRNEQDLLLTLQKSWEFRQQVRPFNDLIEDMSGEQVLTVLHHARNLGVDMDQQWDQYANSHLTSLSRVSVPTAREIIKKYMNEEVDGGLVWKHKKVLELQDHLLRLFTGCDGWPTWFKVATDIPVYPCWKRDGAAYIKDPLDEKDEVLLLSYDGNWYREIRIGIDEDRFFSKELVSAGLLKITRSLLDHGEKPFMSKGTFLDLLESAQPETVQCMARNVQLQKKQGLIAASAPAKLPKLTRTHLGKLDGKDSGFSRKFLQDFFVSAWPTMQKDLKEKKKETDFYKVIERRDSKIRFSKQRMAEVHKTRTSFWSCALSLLMRWSPTFISVPGLLQIQPYVQLQLNFDVRQIINAFRARLGGGTAGKSTALTSHNARVRKCMSCVQEGMAFCDRRSAADHMLTKGHVAAMDQCLPKTRQAQRACHHFLWNVSVDTTSIFSQQVCPCYHSSSGEDIVPDWITSISRCEDMLWPDEYQDTQRVAKLKDWQDGIAAAKNRNRRNKKKRSQKLGMKKTFNFDRSFEDRYADEQKIRKGNQASCGTGYACCELLVGKGKRYRCMDRKSLKDSAGMLSSAWRFVSRGDICAFYKDPQKWAMTKEAFRCSPKSKTEAFEGFWYRLSGQWVKKPMPNDGIEEGGDSDQV